MLRVGLTGGIGSGKSTVARMFTLLGVPVFEADAEAKTLMVSDPDLRTAIATRFGAVVYRTGELDRKALADLVFADAQALADLNALVHPAVRKAFGSWAAGQESPYVLMEAALMAENEGYKQFDRVITVSCPEEERIRRVMERDGVSEEKVRARMRNQGSEEQRLRIAQHVVQNDGSQLVIPQVLAIHAELLTLAAS
jgi:dephospho-CoA kinase